MDESLVKFKGRFKHKQYIPSKKARTGIKLYKCCESKTGYCLDLHVHTNDIVANKKGLVGEQIVFLLAKDYLHKGYVIYMDNWFTSPNLVKKLLDVNTYALGTSKPNRKNFPHELVKKKKKAANEKLDKQQTNQMKNRKSQKTKNVKEIESAKETLNQKSTNEESTTVIRSSNNILALRYSDRKEVYFLTSYHKQNKMILLQKHNGTIQRPECIDDYNKYMGGVDKHDQKLASFSIMRKNVKWYKKLFFYLFDMMIQNSSVVFYKYIQISNLKSVTYTDYRLNLVEQILSKVKLPIYSKKNLTNSINPFRFNINNKCSLENIPCTLKKKNPTLRCKYCSLFNIRSETVYRCTNCLVALHKICFLKYHDSQFKDKKEKEDEVVKNDDNQIIVTHLKALENKKTNNNSNDNNKDTFIIEKS